MKKLISNIFSEKALNLYVVILFGMVFLSIPLFSFLQKFYFITWALTIVLLFFVLLSFVLYRPIKINVITILFLLFLISSFLSSAFTGFKSFLSTPYLNTIIIIIFYTYFTSQETKQKNRCMSVILLSLVLFALIYAYVYRDDLLSLSFSRLGNKFGDENDISIILALGYALSFFYIFKNKKVILKILDIFLTVIFGALSFTCGSKISIILLVIISFFVVTFHFGKKRWYFSIIALAIIIVLIVLALNLSVFSEIKDRFLNMVYTFFGQQYKNLNPDSSTAGRLEMIINGFSLFLRRPLFGFGSYGYHQFSTHHSGWSHNHWSDTLSNYGLIGTFLYHAPFIVFYKNLKNKSSSAFTGITFFLISTLSIALFKEKMFTFSIGLFLSFADLQEIKKIRLFEIFKKKNKIAFNENIEPNKIRVVEIIPSLNPIGGAETMFVNLCRAFKTQFCENIELHVIILYNNCDNALIKKIKDINITPVFLGKHKGIDLGCSYRLAKYLNDIKPDVIHTHLDTSLTLMLATNFRRKYPIVHTFHNMIGDGFKKERLNLFLVKINRLIPVAVSKITADSIIDKTKKTCDFINNGVDLLNFDNSIPMYKRKIDFLCVGSLKPVKNQIFLIKAFKELMKITDGYNLYFLGDGPLKEEYKAEAGLLLNKNIFFAGCVDNVNAYMSNSKIIVIPSISEGNPMVINEALCSGMYVIGSNVGGIPDLIQNGINGDLVELNDLNLLYKTMMQRISDISFLENKRVENANLVNRYSIFNSACEYFALFNKIIKHL